MEPELEQKSKYNSKEYYEANKHRISAQKKSYYQTNRDSIKVKSLLRYYTIKAQATQNVPKIDKTEVPDFECEL